jgi:hypothetical protein
MVVADALAYQVARLQSCRRSENVFVGQTGLVFC